MTMPHLMNCPHSSDGWCLECVAEEHSRNEYIIADLEREVRENRKFYEEEIDKLVSRCAELSDELRQAGKRIIAIIEGD